MVGLGNQMFGLEVAKKNVHISLWVSRYPLSSIVPVSKLPQSVGGGCHLLKPIMCPVNNTTTFFSPTEQLIGKESDGARVSKKLPSADTLKSSFVPGNEPGISPITRL